MLRPEELAIRALNANPRFKNAPMGQQLLNCIQNNDSKTGEELAMNILNTYGISKEQGIEQATNGLKGLFHL